MAEGSLLHTNEARSKGLGDLVLLLRKNPFFQGLADGAISALVAEGHPLPVTAGTLLVRQGDESDSAFLVLSGEIEVFTETPFGPVSIATMGAGELLGEIGAIAGIPRTASVRARTATRLLRIDGKSLLALGRRHPDLLVAVIRLLGERIAKVASAIGFYTQALAALERQDFDPAILDHLLHPGPELLTFAHTFRRMAQQIVERRRHQQELASAAAIQRAMLPRPLAKDGDVRIELDAMVRPAREVGGDLYNHFAIDTDRIAIVIGDVSGKGIPASLFMAITQTVTRIALKEIEDLAIAVTRTNAFVAADNPESMFATLFCGVLDLRSGSLVYANCGHNPPLVLRARGGCESLPVCGPALGILAAARYSPRSITLAPGDRLFLYTDGITEATNAAEELFGEDRLEAACRALAGATPQEMIRSIVGQVDEFVAEAPQFDDIACLALNYRGR